MPKTVPTTLVELYRAACVQYSKRRLFGTRTRGGWHWVTYSEFPRWVDQCRSGLARLGVKPGDRVALIANNRLEWAVVAYATWTLGAVLVPMYQAQPTTEWDFILADSGSRVVVAAGSSPVEHLARLIGTTALEHVIGLDLPPQHARAYDALCSGPVLPSTQQVRPEDVAGLIYTSGTTGKPKGVILTHQNLVSNVLGASAVFRLGPDVTLSFLPWAHSFGQTADLHTMLHNGVSIAINDDASRVLENLGEVRPTLICAVPRIFVRLRQSVEAKLGRKPRWLQSLFYSALEIARRRARGQRVARLQSLELALADRLLFAAIRRKLGGRLRFVVSGSAALGVEVADFVDALGIRVYEGYGLTEASPFVAANCERARRRGSVGRPLPGVRVRVDDTVGERQGQGEVIVHGSNVMRGYHGRPLETGAALLPDGGLRTGDLGYLDGDGFLFITGRLKEQYKLENGKYVLPETIEEQLKMSPLVSQAVVYGDGKPFNVALIVPNRTELGEWARRRGIALGEVEQDPAIRALIGNELAERSRALRSFEKPREFLLVSGEFTVENGLLTPSLKVRRDRVLAKYGTHLNALYASGQQETPTAKPLPSS
jgi:long-chain acyl-CoA synthetase